jgi:hypothetical protein
MPIRLSRDRGSAVGIEAWAGIWSGKPDGGSMPNAEIGGRARSLHLHREDDACGSEVDGRSTLSSSRTISRVERQRIASLRMLPAECLS